jgi:AraC-like DNA-binding protein
MGRPNGAQREQPRASDPAGNGLTFGRWRQQLHLIVALRELSAGASVQQVSTELGYESVTAFITMFKKALGKPPAKYLSDIVQGGSPAFAA